MKHCKAKILEKTNRETKKLYYILDFDTSKTKNKASYRCNGDLGPF